MPFFSCCCSRTDKETEVNHIYKGSEGVEKKQVQEAIKRYNELTNSHAYHYKNQVYTLSEDTILDVNNDPYLFKDIVIDFYRNELLKVDKKLINDLDQICSDVRTVQKIKSLRSE